MIDVILEDINGDPHFEQFHPLDFADKNSIYSTVVAYANSINCRIVDIQERKGDY